MSQEFVYFNGREAELRPNGKERGRERGEERGVGSNIGEDTGREIATGSGQVMAERYSIELM